MKINQCGLLVLGFILAFAGRAYCQTNLQFTAINVTDETNIQLTWSSITNEVYEIEEADALATNADGSTAWNFLYGDYPSQGTNTFWLDTGNYLLTPQILNPKDMPMRFYQIVDLGPDTTSDRPTISITSPTNGSVASGELTVTVAASTDQPTIVTKLYVDGQEMTSAVSSTNQLNGATNNIVDTYMINTCEWPNGTHTLFATAKITSAPAGPANTPPILTAHTVSAFVPVTFNNLVTRISFSQTFFNPSAGQTQQVSAVFATNSNWTLQIEDINSNVVQTASGSGTSMLFNWGGTGTNETALPNGVYYYYISAQTNGGSGGSDEESSGSGSGSPASPDLARSSSVSAASTSSTELWAVGNSGEPVPFAIFPPGFDTNGLTIFEASPREIESLMSSSSSAASPVAMDSGSGFSPDASGAGSPPTSQTSPAAPQRPPNNPVKGVAGTIGIAYDSYGANGTNGFTLIGPPNGLGIPGEDVQIQGANQNSFDPLPEGDLCAQAFIEHMQKGGWQSAFNLSDNQFQISGLKGSSTFFNQVNFGILGLHGGYGTSLDYSVPGYSIKQMYFPVTSGTSAQYLRLSDLNLGGSGTNGLMWMWIDACFSLYQPNWQNMTRSGVYPFNSNLHLLLGANTSSFQCIRHHEYFADYMLFGKPTQNIPPMTIETAYYQAAIDSYNYDFASQTNDVVVLADSGDANCRNDTLQTNNPPTGTRFYNMQQVLPQ